MSVRQSLPSFAVAFATSSLDPPYSSSLPPIQPLTSSERSHIPSRSPEPPTMHNPPPRANGRKRTIHDAHQDDRDHQSSPRASSPRSVRVKEEQFELPEDLHHPSQSQPQLSLPSPPAATSSPSAKKRRVTISGLSHSLDPHSPVPDTSISPVVVGIPSVRDDPAALEQVRNMISVKRNQEALIEQRRGSLSGPPPSSKQQQQQPAPTRPPARSPNAPPARLHPSPGPQHSDLSTPHNALPPPSISFTRRRAGTGNKKKPADIMISPRDPTSNARLAPVIQSAPPVPHGPGRFPHTSTMAIPSLPPVPNQPPRRALPGNVPPTPTRLTMRGALAASSSSNNNTLTVPSTHPVPPSIPIASTLVPPTPSALQTSHNTPKSAFLAPFEMFYDALRDAQELKGWLAAQLQKAERATTALREATERAERDVDERVERRVAGVRDEMASLRRHVEELEDSLAARDGRGRGVAHDQGTNKRSPLITGHSQRKATSPPSEGPALPHDAPMSAVEGAHGSRQASPAPFVRSRRGSTSTMRMEPPPLRSTAQEGVRSPSVKAARRSRRGSVAEREKEASRPASPMEES
ncbi:hypothetical protein OF83DRAFT_116449 [Amylostereum chailletii]|nr:hypothetical protein OF83DRAFT_116449 [Amylostereum chailletii]